MRRGPRIGGRRRGEALALALATLAAAPAAAAEEPPVRVVVQPRVVGLGETVELTFEIPRVEVTSGQFQPRFQIENLRLVGGPARQDSMSLVDGQFTRRVALTWYLTPEEPGIARIHGIEVRLDEATHLFSDETVEVTVEPQRAPPPTRRRSPMDELREMMGRRPTGPREEADVRLVAEVTPRRGYPGQQLVYALYLLVERRRPGEGRVQVETVHPRKLPTFSGFWVQELAIPAEVEPEVVVEDGRPYWRQPVLRRALYPLGPGRRTIEPAEVDLRLIRLRPSFFGEEPLGPEVLARRTAALPIEVEELPSLPTGFSGAVGTFEVEGRLEPATVGAGEGAILTVTLRGDGQLDGLPDLELPAVDGLRAYPPRETSTTRATGGRALSTRTWSWTVVPEAPGELEIPALEWVSFQPAAGEARTHSVGPFLLTATRPAAPAAPVAATPEEVAAPSRPARPSATTLGASGAAAALVVALLLFARRRRRHRRPLRQRLLADLQEAAAAAQPRHAASVAESAWRRYLDERWQVPVGAPTRQWGALLAERGVPRTSAEELVRLVDDLHYLRYAPKLASTEALQEELWQRSRRLLRRLP